MPAKKPYKPKYLGKSVAGPIDRVELIPWKKGDVEITLDCAEFTTICPVTGQPDFGTLEIRYVPRASIVETKSLKLYLQGFRNRKGFNEEIVAALADDLFAQFKPKSLDVTGRYNRRGGSVLRAALCGGEREIHKRSSIPSNASI
ncbi:MAG: preQ(1) synthase [Deltaproteobacteria bacterium]|nr:preQ(1) synthase [Deltaproteobacteria bacterium]